MHGTHGGLIPLPLRFHPQSYYSLVTTIAPTYSLSLCSNLPSKCSKYTRIMNGNVISNTNNTSKATSIRYTNSRSEAPSVRCNQSHKHVWKITSILPFAWSSISEKSSSSLARSTTLALARQLSRKAWRVASVIWTHPLALNQVTSLRVRKAVNPC